MARVILPPQRRTRQPNGAAEIDWSHPLASGLVFAAIPVGLEWFDAVSHKRTRNASDELTIRRTRDGNATPAQFLKGTSAAASTSFAEQTGFDTLVGRFSIFAEARPETNGVTSYIIASREPVATGNGVGVQFDDVSSVLNGMRMYVDNNSAASESSFDILGADSELYAHRVLVTGDGTNHRYYVKGFLATTAATASLPSAHAGRRTCMLGRDTTTGHTSASVVFAWNRVLSLEEYRLLYQNPWQLFKPTKRAIWIPSTVSTITGTFAVTGGNDTLSASGTTTVLGTFARTATNDSISSSGTTTVVGTFTRTETDDTISASGSVGSPVEGTFTVTGGNDTLSASGTTTIVGTLAVTTAADVLSASGTTTIVGTMAVTVANDALSASGTTTIVGTLTVTETDDTINASGSVGSAVSGTFTVTGQNDIMSASGTTTLVGTFTVTGTNDTLSASGNTTVLGALAVTLNNDTLVASGTVGDVVSNLTWRTLTNVGR